MEGGVWGGCTNQCAQCADSCCISHHAYLPVLHKHRGRPHSSCKVEQLEQRLDDLETLRKYCGSKMDSQLGKGVLAPHMDWYALKTMKPCLHNTHFALWAWPHGVLWCRTTCRAPEGIQLASGPSGGVSHALSPLGVVIHGLSPLGGVTHALSLLGAYLK